MAFKKKLYRYRPDAQPPVEAQTTKTRTTPVPCDPRSIERGVRQLLADKAMGNLAGVWLLAPELLRLGAWDLVCSWTTQRPDRVEPRLALQLIHEAALCTTGLRHRRTVNQHIFELANGLPFLATDMAVHELLGARTVVDSQRLQVALGKIRRTSGDFQARLLAIDPHRVRSFSKRHMRRHRDNQAERPTKVAPTFFVLDADTHQPVCFTTATSSRTATTAAEELLELAARILDTQPGQTLVLVDAEHFTVELLDKVKSETNFDLLVPMSDQRSRRAKLQALPPETFQPRWAGYATAKMAYTPRDSQAGPFSQYVQRLGERPEEYRFKAFLSTRDGDEVEGLTLDFPMRWHVEEFFNAHQALGWDRAGTCNLNIRYGQASMALVAQAATDRLRKHLGPTAASWDAGHLSTAFFAGLEGDVRVVEGDTILVTYYNAPTDNNLRQVYQDLPREAPSRGCRPAYPMAVWI
ncbi:MAG: transposase [Isosphaeraceae bacterium]